MSFYDMSVEIAERGHSQKLNGNMTEQSAYTTLRDKAKLTLTEWTARAQAADLISALSGMPTMEING